MKGHEPSTFWEAFLDRGSLSPLALGETAPGIGRLAARRLALTARRHVSRSGVRFFCRRCRFLRSRPARTRTTEPSVGFCHLQFPRAMCLPWRQREDLGVLEALQPAVPVLVVGRLARPPAAQAERDRRPPRCRALRSRPPPQPGQTTMVTPSEGGEDGRLRPRAVRPSSCRQRFDPARDHRPTGSWLGQGQEFGTGGTIQSAS